MLTLFHAPQSRSSRLVWLLEELGLDCDLRYVSIRTLAGTGAPDPANPHPEGKVPTLLHDGVVIRETVAIVQHLTDLAPSAGMAPVPGTPERGR